jgi:hypothetical protein
MGFDQYHEPPEELPAETRTFARMCANLTEEAEAIGWYEQRIALEPDANSRAIMVDSRGEEFKHFSMDLEFLFRQNPQWRETARGILFTDGNIVDNAETSEADAPEAIDQPGSAGNEAVRAPGTGAPELTSSPSPSPSGSGQPVDGSLGIGSLKSGA